MSLFLPYEQLANRETRCSLQRVILANNQIDCVHFPKPPQAWLRLQQLSVSFNRLQLWRDISALAAWAPSLDSLTLIGNPIMTGKIYCVILLSSTLKQTGLRLPQQRPTLGYSSICSTKNSRWGFRECSNFDKHIPFPLLNNIRLRPKNVATLNCIT
jgi:hypothetical protein